MKQSPIASLLHRNLSIERVCSAFNFVTVTRGLWARDNAMVTFRPYYPFGIVGGNIFVSSKIMCLLRVLVRKTCLNLSALKYSFSLIVAEYMTIGGIANVRIIKMSGSSVRLVAEGRRSGDFSSPNFPLKLRTLCHEGINH